MQLAQFRALRFAPPVILSEPKRDFGLEGLRGLCALLVVYGHMSFSTPMLDPKYVLGGLSIDYGTPSVLIFFVLSGYVIGLTVRGLATRGTIGHYLHRRALRIVPIAWAAILLSVVLHRGPAKSVFGNLLFLQNVLPYPLGFRFPLLHNNPPLWSLSYEMLYYLLFVAIWRFSPRVWAVYGVTLVLALGRPLGIPPIISSQAAGMLFWISGLSIAWFTKGADGPEDTPWLAAIVGSFAYWTIGPLRALTLVFFHGYATPSMLSLGRLDFCLGATLIVLTVTNRARQLQRRLAITLLLLCAAILPLKSFEAMLTASDLWAMGFVALAVILWKWRPSLATLVSLAPIGAFSYALYAIHLPIAFAIRDSFGFLSSGSAGSYVARLAMFCAITFPVAWLLECRVQSWISSRWKPAPAKGAWAGVGDLMKPGAVIAGGISSAAAGVIGVAGRVVAPISVPAALLAPPAAAQPPLIP